MSRRAARIAVLLVDDLRGRLAGRGQVPPGAGVLFDEVWPLAKELAARERSLELAADWHAAVSAESRALLDEGLAAASARLAPPVPAGEGLRFAELDPLGWRLSLEPLPPSAAELAGWDRRVASC
jgi:hypothetical protein